MIPDVDEQRRTLQALYRFCDHLIASDHLLEPDRQHLRTEAKEQYLAWVDAQAAAAVKSRSAGQSPS